MRLVPAMAFTAGGLSLLVLAGVAMEVPEGKTYTDYSEWADFPDGIDCEDEQEILRWQRWVEKGEAIYPLLMAVARDSNDRFLVSHALAILRESQGNKRGVFEELKELFRERLPGRGRDAESILVDIARTLAATGTEDDAALLIPMLEHPGWEVRCNGARFLGQRGGTAALEALKEMRERELGRTEREEVEAAISAIEARMVKENNQMSGEDGHFQ